LLFSTEEQRRTEEKLALTACRYHLVLGFEIELVKAEIRPRLLATITQRAALKIARWSVPLPKPQAVSPYSAGGFSGGLEFPA
jgi:hypothetical protein